MAVTHSTVATSADEDGAEVNKTEWNADHVIDNGTITNDHLAGSITNTKLATDPLARANHTGTQAQSTVTDLTTDLALKSPLASPTFTGTVAIPNYANVESTLDTIETNRAPLASPTFTGTVTTAALDVAGNDIDNIQNLIHGISVSGTDIDFSEDQLQTISISANTTFTTTNRTTGKSKTIKITTDGSTRNLTFPAWKFVGTKPAEQAASKIGILTVTCFGTADTDIVAAYAVEE
jgi:hypothetical protein